MKFIVRFNLYLNKRNPIEFKHKFNFIALIFFISVMFFSIFSVFIYNFDNRILNFIKNSAHEGEKICLIYPNHQAQFLIETKLISSCSPAFIDMFFVSDSVQFLNLLETNFHYKAIVVHSSFPVTLFFKQKLYDILKNKYEIAKILNYSGNDIATVYTPK